MATTTALGGYMPETISATPGPSWGVGSAVAPPRSGSVPRPNYNINPGTQSGSGAYGAVPGAIGLPNPAEDLAALYPNLTGANTQVSQNIMGELKGELSPETINSIQDEAARFGVASGMPGSGLSGNRGLRNLGLSVENLQGKGLSDYLSALTGISHTQTVSPELQSTIAGRNAEMAAAPNPQEAAQRLEQLARGGGSGGPSPWGGGNINTPGIRLPSGGTTAPKPMDLSSLYGRASQVYNAVGPFDDSTPSVLTSGGFYDLPTGNAYGGGPDSGYQDIAGYGNFEDFADLDPYLLDQYGGDYIDAYNAGDTTEATE